MKLKYSKRSFLVSSLLVAMVMGAIVSFRLEVIHNKRSAELTEMAKSVSRRVSRAILPAIWGIHKKSTERFSSDKTASALLDYELEERQIVAILVYGNFGHFYMGRIKVSADKVVPYERKIHEKLSVIKNAKVIRKPVTQGSMTIGSVIVYYSEDGWFKKREMDTVIELLDLLIITLLILGIMYFALIMSRAKYIAEKASVVKSEFLANMSHEIRTPMNAMLGLLELLRSSDLNNEQRANLDVIFSSSTSLLGILNDVLDISKIEAGKVDIYDYDVAMIDVVHYLSVTFKEAVKTKNIDYKLVVATGVPDIVVTDGVRVKQILINLVSNAIKFTAKGGVLVSISCTDNRHSVASEGVKNTTLTFSVEDTGVGVSPENRKKLFKNFSQAEASTTRRFGGTGLGLAISLKLAKLMGGDITYKSRVSGGSCFEYVQPVDVVSKNTLPDQVLMVNASVQVKDTDVETATPHIPDTDYSKILVVEDNAINRMVVSKQLKALGHNADFANDGVEGLGMWNQHAYSIIFSDCQMPEMDGYEMTRNIRKIEAERLSNEHVPIIAFTANVMLHDREKCISAGMDDVVGKPCSIGDIHEMLIKWMPDSDIGK